MVKADADSSPIVRLAVTGRGFGVEELSRIVEKDIIPALISVEGVADVTIFGDRRRLLRVVIDPLRLSSYQLSVGDVIKVMDTAPFDIPTGSFASLDQELLVRADATVETEREVEALVIREPVRVGDVADVFFGPEDAESYVRVNGEPVIGISIISRMLNTTTFDFRKN